MEALRPRRCHADDAVPPTGDLLPLRVHSSAQVHGRVSIAELPYAINTGTLAKFFKAVQEIGVPTKVTQSYLASIGYSSSNDRYLVALLKDLGFTSPDGAPQQRWRDFRHTGEAPRIMAEAIRYGWSGLFDAYPDAHRRDDEAVRNWMRSHAPGASPTTVDRSLKTFRALIPIAKDAFDTQPTAARGAASAGPQEEATAAPTTVATIPSVPSMPRQATPEVIINIQLQIPETDNAEIYDRFFAAMRKHLFPGE